MNRGVWDRKKPEFILDQLEIVEIDPHREIDIIVGLCIQHFEILKEIPHPVVPNRRPVGAVGNESCFVTGIFVVTGECEFVRHIRADSGNVAEVYGAIAVIQPTITLVEKNLAWNRPAGWPLASRV